MSESGQRQRVIRALKSLHAIPVENPIRAGTPDVNCTAGWIELKWVRRWPVRAATLVRIDHYTREQKRWLRKRHRAGGGAWLLLQCGREWLLFSGETAHDHVGNVTRHDLYQCAKAVWRNGLKDKELSECLTRDWDNWDGSPLGSGTY